MTTAIDELQPPRREPDSPTGACAASDLAALTPETAQRLAAVLAPHLLAMRAVTAGTRYAWSADAESTPAESTPAVSPATKIFIAGMLHRLPA